LRFAASRRIWFVATTTAPLVPSSNRDPREDIRPT
jgi:hypothetical protein